jgi:hypothetical protein
MADPLLGYQLAQQGINLAETSQSTSTFTNTSPFNYRYPLSKLTSSDDYLKIDIVKYIPPGLIPEEGTFALPSSDDVGYIDKLSGDTASILGTIILPIPDDIRDNNNAQWGTSSLNPIQSAVVSGAAGLLGTKSIDDFKNKIDLTIKKSFGAATSGTTQKYAQALAIEMAQNVLLGKSDSNIPSRYAGVVANPNLELVFTGVTLRDGFSFGFDMTPRSQKEAEVIKQIIRKFKYHSAAKKGRTGGNASGLFLQAPEVFRIQYMSGSRPHPYLNKFKICALKGMSVNYAPGGTYATYSDGAPVNVQLGLGFQELTPIYAEDYNSGIGRDGVGY